MTPEERATALAAVRDGRAPSMYALQVLTNDGDIQASASGGFELSVRGRKALAAHIAASYTTGTPLEQARQAAREAQAHHTATMDALDAAIDAERAARRAVWVTNEAAWDAARAERAAQREDQS